MSETAYEAMGAADAFGDETEVTGERGVTNLGHVVTLQVHDSTSHEGTLAFATAEQLNDWLAWINEHVPAAARAVGILPTDTPAATP
jgi:hypothetical protein